MRKKLHRSKFKISALLVLFASMVFLFACSNESQLRKLQNYIESIKISTKKTKPVKAEPIRLPAPANYQAETIRAPFENTQTLPKNKNNINTNPLLVYPVNVLRFVGTISKNNRSVAYVQAPDTKLYQVKVGDLIGDHGGKIIKIYPYRIEIIEMVEQESSIGKITTKNNVVMELREEKK